MKARCLLIGVVVLFVVGVLTSPSYAEIDPKTCVGIWRFDEGIGDTATDSSGNGNDGNLIGDPKWVGGKFGKALEFNGVDDYVDLPQLPEQTNQPLSFTAWIKWGGSTDAIRGIWGYTTVSGSNCHFEIRTAGMRLRLCDVNKTDMTSPPVNQWAFVGFTYDSTTARYYLNGIEVDSIAGDTGTLFGAESALGHTVGVSDASDSRFFDGLIDEAAIFNVALEEEDIQGIMTAVSPSGKLAATWASIKIQY